MVSKSTNLEQTINNFNDAFSNQRLEEVMQYFSPQAEFRGLDGKVAKGTENIRKAFQRLFDGAYGQVVFVPKNLIIDEAHREASFVWSCQHKLEHNANLSLANRMLFSVLKLLHGRSFYWEGIDYFIFDENNKIVSKQTYGKSSYPKFIRGVFA